MVGKITLPRRDFKLHELTMTLHPFEVLIFLTGIGFERLIDIFIRQKKNELQSMLDVDSRSGLILERNGG